MDDTISFARLTRGCDFGDLGFVTSKLTTETGGDLTERGRNTLRAM